MLCLFKDITATASLEVDTRRCKDVMIVHEIVSGSTGGYCSFVDRAYGQDSATGVKIEKAVLSSNVVTITTSAAHGLAANQKVVISGVTGTAAFSGTYTVKAAGTTTTFTYDLTSPNETGVCSVDARVRRVVDVAHLAAASSGGINIQTGNQSSSYTAVVQNCADYLYVTCNVNGSNGGTHRVYAKLLPEGGLP